ncbi:hypothetical protein TUN199_06675 [Pyrenophora tritici-repentis]|uniref:DUF3984 multi-domain protein n=2 Tax=Pyrenophora tritici-repentis TaxID=45151 RepID=A0A2W1G6F0_9PLEO|nr:uncharacterized protein PTRG_09334 [Pyrenophora tritici-repentis Pt-1C-BFP]KAF7441916.1 hypothetical protein A1F99_137680 [Pyrenophora tritici-repentis]EDU42385.1 hypothetical protein PTRG_09334 [Pyrenophora tritici-repentis Pt-1C-BFP]KAF7567928.1 DUF3984 multi-domain protein [Pyrenophora tritici-repentis]KAI0577362.1 hypothetical protein Alg215_06959 [Pyrenophora tritici-repentis]KAI0582652.1 hypothetical protein Alg130_06063 [Pyrenophora tritici-repentis]
MSRSSYPQTIAASVSEQRPAAVPTKPSRPASVQYRNFSNPLADDLPSAVGAKPVGAEELQARIKAARRSRTVSQPLPEAVQRQLDQAANNPDLIHPALRARSGVPKNIHRSASHQCKPREELSIEAVMRRFSAESDGKAGLSRSRPTTPGELDGPPPVSALPAHLPPANYRPRSYPTRSRRSSMTKRPSPLSYVSSPDDSTDACSHTSRRTSASSRTSRTESKSDSCKDDDKDDMIRVVTLEASKSRLSKRKHELESRAPPGNSPEVAQLKSPPAKNRSSWHNLSRRSILCSV